MGIEKMNLVSVEGEQRYLDNALIRCAQSGLFHPEQAAVISEYSGTLAPMHQENTFTPLVKRAEEFLDDLGLEPPLIWGEDPTNTQEEIKAVLDELAVDLKRLESKRRGYTQAMETHQQTLRHLEHLATLDVNFDDLFSCQYLKIRFGRLPVDSYDKIHFYDEKPFVFFTFDKDSEYYWSLYLTSRADATEVDNLFASLYFERLIIPSYAHGTPQKAIQTIHAHMKTTQKSLDNAEAAIRELAGREGGQLIRAWLALKFWEHEEDMKLRAMDLRHYAATGNNHFEIIGFVPQRSIPQFRQSLEGLEVKIGVKPADAAGARLTVPVSLRNNWLNRPFEMFVTMYGLPNYKDFDPTPLVSITYMLLFGIMFGDVGQGLTISLIGWLMYRFKKMQIGEVMIRMGVVSALFGLVYGSVFGFEYLLDPMYHALGFAHKPVHVMEANTTNFILIAAVGLGVVIISLSMTLNIILSIRRKQWGRAFFSNNGVAGMVFYLSAIGAAVATLAFGYDMLVPAYVIPLLILPFVVMLLSSPLTKLVMGKKDLFHEGVGTFLAESIFEMFEVLLSFVTNTISFLRVGGFVLVHAGMMAVVFTLSGMVSTAASPIIIILGNAFVMGIEGLIVGIQVLRLEFYEIFSRFYDGDGKAYQPVSADHV